MPDTLTAPAYKPLMYVATADVGAESTIIRLIWRIFSSCAVCSAAEAKANNSGSSGRNDAPSTFLVEALYVPP